MVDSLSGESVLRLAVAAGIGLLIGLERERRMAERGRRGTAGIRTFALVALLGGAAEQVGGVPVLTVALAFVAAAALIGYLREPTDLGITTEIALVVAFMLGVLAQREPATASGLAVAVTILLATRTWLHHFAAAVLTADEVHDGLLLAAAALVVLPLLPDRTVDPFDTLNPFAVWRLVVLLMALSSAGYVAVRLLGPRYGLPLAGLVGGFISSTATVAAMGGRARRLPSVSGAATSAALFSTVATVLQMAAVIAVTSRPVLRELAVPLLFAGLGAVAVASLSLLRGRAAAAPEAVEYGRAFDLRSAVVLGVAISGITFFAAAAAELGGGSAVQLAAAFGGLADAHSAAIGVAAVVASGKLDVTAGAVGVLLAFSANTVSKVVVAYASGGRGYAARVAAGLAVVLALAWLGAVQRAL
ncbi:MAG: MgtC/SapB family protein [Dehalococcoidia bacterium]